MQRVVEIERFEGEEFIEKTLRPSKWSEYIGQERIKSNLKVLLMLEILGKVSWSIGVSIVGGFIATPLNLNPETIGISNPNSTPKFCLSTSVKTSCTKAVVCEFSIPVKPSAK